MNAVKIDRHGHTRDRSDKASSLAVAGHGCGNHSDMDYYMILYDTGKRIFIPTLFDL